MIITILKKSTDNENLYLKKICIGQNFLNIILLNFQQTLSQEL